MSTDARDSPAGLQDITSLRDTKDLASADTDSTDSDSTNSSDSDSTDDEQDKAVEFQRDLLVVENSKLRLELDELRGRK